MSLEVVLRWFNRIPPAERDLPLVIDEVTGRAYSPRAVVEEVRKGTDVGRRLQKKIERGEMTPPTMLKQLAKYRLKKTLEALPQGWGIATASGRIITKEQLLELIEKEEDFGKKFIEQEIKRMKQLVARGKI